MGKKKNANHYIDNKEFYAAMVEWKEKIKEAEEVDEPRPPVTEYIGKCFMDIAEHLAYRPNFMNYPYKDEMIGDGIENCILYAHNFDPEKSKNPFSYFTQIIYYAFLRRIEKEKKNSYTKYKMLEMNDVSGLYSKYFKENYFGREGDDKTMKDVFNLTEKDLEKFEPKKKKKRKKKASLDDVMEDKSNEDSSNK